MAVRHPPRGHVPPAGRNRRPRMVRYEEPAAGFWRRWLRRIFRPPVVIALVFLATISIGVLGYYYWVFSARIDSLLRGEIFTRSAGIYAAPRTLRAGATMTPDELIERLRRAGYVERAEQADSGRGRFARNGLAVDIEPGESVMVDGRRLFPRLRAQFARGGRSIATLTDLDANARIESAFLEPEMISSVTGRERERRRVVGFQDLPPHLVQAITVTEDRTFFQHYGINVRGIVRAFLRRYDSDPNSPIARQGGSSITQQLVKNLLLSPEPTWQRKFAEAYMSVIIETRLTKEQIFSLYCNEVYLGQQAGFSINGFGEAAQAYFGKDVTQVTLPEAAFLAGILRSPNRYNPYRDKETATARRNQVLDSMADAGVISAEQATQAKATELRVVPRRHRIDRSEAPYFVDYAQTQLGEILADTTAAGNLRIYTSVDMDLQRAAYTAVNRQLTALDRIYARRRQPGALQAALVAMNTRTGEIVAMVGGRDYEQSQLNRAADARRQPGSVFKPFVYAAALNTAYDPVPRTITAATTYTDAPKTFYFDNQEYSPGNYGDQYSNAPVTLRDALVKSLNVVTVDIAMDLTIGRVMNLAARAGLPRPQRNYPAMALGSHEATPLQMASAYTAFAANGTRVAPTAITRITTGAGQTVAAPVPQRNDVMRPEVAYIMTDMMKDVINRGTAARARARGFRAVAAGKTGTSRDGWFAGYTPGLVCVVWVGLDDGSQLGLTGADSALPIWTEFMTAAMGAHPEWGGDWEMPNGIERAEIDPRTGGLASPDSVNRRTELFISGTAPTAISDAPYDDSTLPDDLPEGTTEPGAVPLPPTPQLPDELPPPTDTAPRSRTRTPTIEGRGVTQPDGSTRLMGTITLDIDPTTGLIAVDTCPVIRTRTYAIGQEPRRYCGPEHHTGRAQSPTSQRPPAPPSSSRPRTVAPNSP